MKGGGGSGGKHFANQHPRKKMENDQGGLRMQHMRVRTAGDILDSGRVVRDRSCRIAPPVTGCTIARLKKQDRGG